MKEKCKKKWKGNDKKEYRMLLQFLTIYRCVGKIVSL